MINRGSPEGNWSNLALLRLNAFSFGITGFILAMDTVVLPVIVLAVAPEQFKNTYLTILGISGLAVAALVQPAIGRFSDRTTSPVGRRVPFLIWGTVFACVGLVGVRLAPNFLVLFSVWIFIQANVNIAYAPGLALIRDMVPLHRIGIASSLKILSDAVGGVVLIAVSGALFAKGTGAGLIDWEWLTLALVALGTVWGVSITVVTVVSREVAEGGGDLPQEQSEQDAPVLNSQLGLFLASRFLMITSIASFQTYGLFFLHDVVGLADPAQALGRMILAVGGALAVAVYISGWASDHVGRKPVVILGASGAAASTLMMLWASNATEVVWTASIIGASVGTLLSANWALANELGSQKQAGLHMGIVNLATIGGSAMAKLFGPGIDLLNRVESVDNLGWKCLIAGCAALFVIGALILMPVRTTGAREPAEPSAPPPA